MSDSNERGDGTSRRGFLKTLGAAGATAVAGAASGQPPPMSNTDQVVALTNGRIHTIDGRGTVADHVVIRNSVFASVGGGRPPAGAHVIDLKGHTVVPGLVEPHVHIVSLANRPGYHTILENTTSIKEVQEALAARRKDVPEGQWITSMGGWHTNQWAEHRHPTLAELDEAVPDRPVFLYERFTGPAAANSMAKKFFDAADAGAPAHPDIKKINVSATGAIGPAGFGTGGPSASALFLLRKLQTFADKTRSTLDAMNYSTSVGLTTHLDQVLFPTPGPLHPAQILSNLDQYTMYDPWLDLYRKGKTTVRLQINFLSNQADPALPELHERLRNQFQFIGDDMVRTGAIGEWAAPISAGATWFEAQRLVAAKQWRNENSVQTLAQLTQVVEAYEKMDQEFGIKDLRWAVHHVPEVTPELLTRLKALGCGVEMAAFRWVTSSDPNEKVGPQFRTIVDHGIQAGIHGDGVHIAPLNPWHHIHYAVTGVNSFGAQVNPGQHLTRQEAISLFTRSNSWFLRMEDRIGSIEPGKLADLTVLDRDYFTVPDADIKKIRPVLTILGGKVVHDSGALKV
ncbi:MAG: amidohydrolase family protein [Gammaproteobacteria bacterium]